MKAATPAVHDARWRQGKSSQVCQRRLGVIIQINEQRGQREDVILAAAPPASHPFLSQSDGEVCAPAKPVCCVQSLECFVKLVRLVERDMP